MFRCHTRYIGGWFERFGSILIDFQILRYHGGESVILGGFKVFLKSEGCGQLVVVLTV